MTAENRIYQDRRLMDLQQIRRMPEPNDGHPVGRKRPKIRTHGRDRMRWLSIRRPVTHFPQHLENRDPRHRYGGGDKILEMIVLVMGRLQDALQPGSGRGFAEYGK